MSVQYLAPDSVYKLRHVLTLRYPIDIVADAKLGRIGRVRTKRIIIADSDVCHTVISLWASATDLARPLVPSTALACG